MRVLVTGAAGSIGRVLVPGLSDLGHRVRGLDRVAAPTVDIVGDCLDSTVVAGAVDGSEAVVHLAGIPTEDQLALELESHVLTTATLLDAMVLAGSRRMVYASSNHAVGMHESGGTLGTDARPRPDTFYGVAKVAAEATLSLYADRQGISSVALRIGSYLERPTTVRHLATWLSPDDCVRMVHASLTAEVVGVAVVYGISANTRAWWDLEPGRALGYHPEDDAEAFAADVPPGGDDHAEGSRVGGPFAGPAFTRPSHP
jgi:uronate dehydrogenase